MIEWLVVIAYFGAVFIIARKTPVALAHPFLTSNVFKAWMIENIPIFSALDYTIFCVILMLFGCALRMKLRNMQFIRIPWPLLGIQALLMISLAFVTDFDPAWSRREMLQCIGFNTVALLAPAFLLHDLRDFRVLGRMLLLFGVYSTAVIWLESPTAKAWHWRGVFLRADPIDTARYFSHSLLMSVATWSAWRSYTGIGKAWAPPIAVGLTLGLLRTGSRGPMVQLAIALAVLLATPKKISNNARLAIIFVMLASVALGVWVNPRGEAIKRMSTLVDARGDGSINARFEVWEYVLLNFDRALFFGHGLGELEHSFVGLKPHSLTLDLLHAGGLLGAFLFYGMILLAWLSWRHVANPPLRDPEPERLIFPLAALLGLHVIESTTGYSLYNARRLFFLSSSLWMGTQMLFRLRAAERAIPASSATGPSLNPRGNAYERRPKRTGPYPLLARSNSRGRVRRL